MKKIVIIGSLIFGLSTQGLAQELPQLSPKAELEQTIGLTDVEIEYSRPSRRDREIFGGLLPYGEMWRTGANGRATIEFEETINIEGKDLKPGKYSILTIPHEGSWIVILNTDTESWGKNDYDEAKDVARFKVEVKSNDRLEETFTIGFDNFTESSATLFMAWEKVRVELAVKTYTEKKAWKNIDEALKEKPEDARVLRNAAKYAALSGKRLDEATKWIDKSIKLDESWFSYVVKARVQAANGNVKEAHSTMDKAIKMGEAAAKEKGETFNYKNGLNSEKESWK